MRPNVGGAAAMRNQFKDKLRQQTESSYKTKDQNANTFKDYFDKDKLDGVKFYKVPTGDVDIIFDVIPYCVGKHDPHNKEGEFAYHLDIFVHRKIGPTNEQIVCLSQYGKPCPICEEVEIRKAAGEDWKTRIKPLVASRRVMYNIINRDSGEQEKKGNQVWEISHFFMEKKIAGIVKDPRTGGIKVFSDPDTGSSICCSKRTPSKDTVEYSGHRFSDRPCPITDEELNAAVCLDNLVKILTYDDIYTILYATAETEAGAEQSSETANQSEQTQQRQEPTGTGAVDTNTTTAEPPPRMENRRERPVETETTATQADVCPQGGTFGASCDEFPACATCSLYDKCSALADSM